MSMEDDEDENDIYYIKTKSCFEKNYIMRGYKLRLTK